MRWFAKVDLPRWAGPANVVACVCAGFALAVPASRATAEGTIAPYASVGYAYQTNPLYQWGGTAANRAASADSLLRLTGGADVRFALSRQSLAANVEVRRFEYDTLTYLARTEELLSGTYEWTPIPSATATASYRHEHRMVPFDELVDVREQLMESENILTASLGLHLARVWELVSRLQARDLASPRPGVPDLNLHETSLREALRRTIGDLSLGLETEYISGSYHGAGSLNGLDYRQTTVQLAAERAIKGFSTFECAIGDTTRDSARGSDLSTLTGFARYERALTGKTSAEVFVRRGVNSYVTGATSEIDTAAGVQATWQATPKLRAVTSIAHTRSEFARPRGTTTGSRRDEYDAVSLELHYDVLDSLALIPYGRYAARASSVRAFGFNAREIGIELALRTSR